MEWAERARARVGQGLAVEVEPAAARPGREVTIYVTGGTSQVVVRLALTDSAGNVLWNTSTWAKSDGALRYEITLPNPLAEGPYTVVASTATDSVAANLEVTA